MTGRPNGSSSVASTELAEALGADEVADLREQLKRELERVDREQRARRAA